MTPDQADMVNFLRQQYAVRISDARTFGNTLITRPEAFRATPEAAAHQARSSIHAAETRARFLDETVVPYLGTAGPTGRIADQQLRLLTWEHQGSHGYEEGWAP